MRESATSKAASGSASASASAARTSTWPRPSAAARRGGDRGHLRGDVRQDDRALRADELRGDQAHPTGPAGHLEHALPRRRRGAPEQRLGDGRPLLVDARRVTVPAGRGGRPLRALHGPELVGVHAATLPRPR